MARLDSVLLTVTALLWFQLVNTQDGRWSGYVNDFSQQIDYICPDDLALSGIASDFISGDRRWEFHCSSGSGLANVSLSCSLQPPINTLQTDISFNCPSNGYLAGFVSEYTAGSTDRVWQPYCCTRPFGTVINCQIPTTSWQNILRDNLNFTSPDGHVIAGLQSFYFNRDRRWRFRTCEVQVDCGDPGIPDNAVRDGNNFLYNSTVSFTCNHGYYQSSGPVGGVRHCLETGLWSEEQPACSLCTEISNCADVRCSNSSDQTCALCESNNGPARGESAFTNLGTECLPRCSWLNTFCYPGVCPDLPSSCNCTEGFEGLDCLQISGSPQFQSCVVTIEGQDGNDQSLPCQPNSTVPMMYTNIVPHQLMGQWDVVYVTPTPLPDRPAYVSSFSVGVAVSQIQANLFRAANPASPVSMTTHPCEAVNVSPDTPTSGMVMCSSTAMPTNLSTHTFLHGDTFELSAVANAGGYLDIINLDTSRLQRHYYRGDPTIGRATFILDLQPPTHCSLVSFTICLTNQNILGLSGDIVTTNQIAATWGGWVDTPSGVVSYEISVYYLELSAGLLVEGALVKSNQTEHTGQLMYDDITTLPREGPYSFVLQSHDLAGNTRYSRRALLYDFNSSVEIDHTSPLVVVSAVPGTGHLWQNSTGSIMVIGEGHFYNTNLRATNYLAPLANFSLGGAIGEEFDQPLAQGRFPRAGTTNALGVVELTYDVIVDQMGGNSTESLTQPTVFPFQTSDVGIRNLEINTPTQDGDSVRVWFRAVDFRFQDAVDSVLVHFDSSPPILTDLGLEWNGVSGLDLHGTGSLVDLDIRFQAYDEHSGIFDVEWSIETVFDSQLAGSGSLPVPTADPTSCVPPDCYCDPLQHCTPLRFSIRPPASDFFNPQALHDTDYIVTITVTNHALLTSTLEHRFTVDTTAPLTGHVFDGNRSHDIDYQTTFELSAWWMGFFDRESDVAFYQYLFDIKCSNSTTFMYPLEESSQVIQTTVATATWTAPSSGTYYVTVVAFNQALQPSSPVCSDGVTVDTVAPEIMGVVIPGATVRPGLVMDVSGDLWYVREDRVRVQVDSSLGACLNVPTPMEDLSPYPIGYEEPPADVCTTSTPYTPSQLIHLTKDHTLNVSWLARDNVGIDRFEVGLISKENFTSDGRNIQYFHTAGQKHFSFFDQELLSNGNRFYLSVRVVDLAQQDTMVNVGPIQIDVTPPTFNGSLETIQDGDHVTLTWNEHAFSDSESGIGSFEFAVGKTEFGIQVLSFRSLPLTLPPRCPTPFCVSIDTGTINPPPLSGRGYYITIKATNQAGLSTYISTPFTHTSQPPSLGFVFDTNPRMTFDLTRAFNSYNRDIDMLVDTGDLGVRWGGFVHPSLPVTFSIALGTQPGLDDVVPLTSVGMATEYLFSNVTLVHGNMYYSSVVAQNSYGNVTVSSDGVLVLMNVSESLDMARVVDGLSPVDIDYQASTSAVSAMWVFPALISAHVSHYEWGVVREGSLEAVAPFSNVGRDTAITGYVRELEVGVTYMSAVRACFPDLCLDPVLSNGFQISVPPYPGSIQAVYTPIEIDEQYGVSTYGSLDISWDEFIDPQIAYYEWSIGNGDMGMELLMCWTQTAWQENQVPSGTLINASISLHMSNYVTVRGYNSAGLYSMSSTLLKWNLDGEVVPQSQVPRTALVVFDITESDVPQLLTDNWKEIEHFSRQYTDLNYIGASDQTLSLSAVWPGLRYRQYYYSISTRQEFVSCDENDPGAIACGVTINNGATVSDLDLVDGQRYYFCVQGLLSDAIHPTPLTPPTLTHCSNGITVDLRAPVSGCVQIISPSLNESDHMTGSGSGLNPNLDITRECTGNGTLFQVSDSEIFVVWDEFSDVEVGGNAVHHTGVAYYQYSIGTSPGANDVVDFSSVGVATYAVATGLSLQSGLTYYVTVRGIDFVGHMTDAFSQAVTVDTTPPDLGRLWIEGVDDYIDNGLTLNWDTPRDSESGVSVMEWGLGSRPGSSDIMEWRPVDVRTALRGDWIEGRHFVDGQIVFLSLKVTNSAGHVSVSSSLAYTLDSTPPVPGLVYDGPYVTADISDLDYSTELGMLSSHWVDFIDPHSAVVEYFVSVGTDPGMSDIQESISVGMATSFTFSDLTLAQGHTYYTTVTACNALGLCSSASSNGITVDVTQPITGQVLSGFSGPDIQFQASRYVNQTTCLWSTLSAHWTGFHDDESSIQYYMYYVGLYPNDSSITMPTQVPPTQTSFVIPVSSSLSASVVLYTTVVAVNGAEVKGQSTSSGVYIDDTSPEILDGVAIITEWTGSVDMATQYSTSAIQVGWNYADPLTSVNNNYWSLLSDSNVQNPTPGKVVGSQPHTTCTNLNIGDGDLHQAILIGCNQAGLCSQSISQTVLFDSSPPVDGYFASFSESTAVLNRTVPGGMTWRNRNLRGYAELNIAFLGFSDPHSGISEYWVSVGTKLGSTDLMPSLQPEVIQPSLASEERGVYLALVQLSRLLVETEILYVSLWAVNGVGLKSHTVQSSFTVDPEGNVNNNGTLTLLRSSSCSLASCMGHCTCGARGAPCNFGSLAPCEELDVSTLPPERQVIVRAVSSQLMAGANDSTLFTALTDKLVGEWMLVDPISDQFELLEWSVSEEGLPPGAGVMNMLNNGIWRGVDSQSQLVFSSAEPLKQGVTYVFYVRAWYSSTSYAMFTSNGITVDTLGPEAVLGERVRVVDGVEGVRFTSDHMSITTLLEGVFSPLLSGGLSTFQVAIGDSPHADNIHPYTAVTTRESSFTGLDLRDGRSYYLTAQATSPLGVITTSVSHRLTVDLTPPDPGHLFTGLKTQDTLAQANSTAYSARWLSFNDPTSGINHYELALTSLLATPPDTQYTDMGISLRGSLDSLNLVEGETYFPHFVAVNNAGLRSPDIVSTRGVVVDTSPPVGFDASNSGDNLLSNPSFEGGNTTQCSESMDDLQATRNWTLSGESEVLDVYNQYGVLPYDGCNALLFVGTVSQSFDTSVGLWYRASLIAHRFSLTSHSYVTLSLPGVSSVCELAESDWIACELLFQAQSPLSTLQIRTPSNEGLVIDAVGVVSLTDYSAARNRSVSVTNTDPSNVIRIGLEPVIAHSQMRLHAHWLIADPQSGIRGFQWAVGTVRGGQQKQQYMSTGSHNYGVSDRLYFTHGEEVYVSVVATNYAELTSVFYSQPFIVDLTPPITNGSVTDGLEVDLDYQRSGVVSADWSTAIDDRESGLLSCQWAIGTSPGTANIQPYVLLQGDVTSFRSYDLSPLLPHGTKVYSTVTCLNRAGRYANVYSDGVTILTTPPNATSAYAFISSPEMTQYDIILGYVPSNRLILTWGGFVEESGAPLEYEVRVTNVSGTGEWERVGFLRQLTLNDIQLPGNETNGIEVRAVSLAGLGSEPVSREFTILSAPPLHTGVRVNDTWLSLNQLHLDWSSTFSSPAPLRYELSLGSQRGSGSIRMWVEFSSEQTSLTLSDPRLVRTNDYYLSLIAIGASGLHVTANQVIAGIPIVT